MKKIPIQESDFGLDQLKRADAVFLTGTSPGLVPVAQIDELFFNPANKILRDLMDEYKLIISSYIIAWKNEV
jgi:branched-chain amino acid aminotransferase